jgi:hypothetical protein
MRCVAVFRKAAVKLFLEPSGTKGRQSAAGQQSVLEVMEACQQRLGHCQMYS